MGGACREGGLPTQRSGRSLPDITPDFGATLPEELWGDGEPVDAGAAAGQGLPDTDPGKIGQGSGFRPRLQASVSFFPRV